MQRPRSPAGVNQRDGVCRPAPGVFGPFLKGYLFVLNKQPRKTPLARAADKLRAARKSRAVSCTAHFNYRRVRSDRVAVQRERRETSSRGVGVYIHVYMLCTGPNVRYLYCFFSLFFSPVFFFPFFFFFFCFSAVPSLFSCVHAIPQRINAHAHTRSSIAKTYARSTAPGVCPAYVMFALSTS